MYFLADLRDIADNFTSPHKRWRKWAACDLCNPHLLHYSTLPIDDIASSSCLSQQIAIIRNCGVLTRSCHTFCSINVRSALRRTVSVKMFVNVYPPTYAGLFHVLTLYAFSFLPSKLRLPSISCSFTWLK